MALAIPYVRVKQPGCIAKLIAHPNIFERGNIMAQGKGVGSRESLETKAATARQERQRIQEQLKALKEQTKALKAQEDAEKAMKAEAISAIDAEIAQHKEAIRDLQTRKFNLGARMGRFRPQE